MPTVSILTPVFNTAAYLERCRASVLSQTVPDWEWVLVDDASTDESLSVLQSFASADPRIKVQHFPANRGVAAARNALLDAATGEYVYFLDSDDWIEPDCLAVMLAHARETGQDVVINAHYVKEYDDVSKNRPSGSFGFIREEGFYPPCQVQNALPPSLIMRLYRRAYLQEGGIRFPEDLRNGEDNYFVGLAEMRQARSYIFRGPAYHYYQRPESLSHQRACGYEYLLSFKYLYESLLSHGVDTEPLRLFYADQIVLDTQDKFDTAREFLLRIGDQVRRHAGLYVARDLFLLDAVCACPDYATYLSRFSPQVDLSFLRSRMRAGAGSK